MEKIHVTYNEALNSNEYRLPLTEGKYAVVNMLGFGVKDAEDKQIEFTGCMDHGMLEGFEEILNKHRGCLNDEDIAMLYGTVASMKEEMEHDIPTNPYERGRHGSILPVFLFAVGCWAVIIFIILRFIS